MRHLHQSQFVAAPDVPTLNWPSTARVNMRHDIICSGNVGRDIDGKVETTMQLEVKLSVRYFPLKRKRYITLFSNRLKRFFSIKERSLNIHT